MILVFFFFLIDSRNPQRFFYKNVLQLQKKNGSCNFFLASGHFPNIVFQIQYLLNPVILVSPWEVLLCTTPSSNRAKVCLPLCVCLFCWSDFPVAREAGESIRHPRHRIPTIPRGRVQPKNGFAPPKGKFRYRGAKHCGKNLSWFPPNLTTIPVGSG